MSRKGKRSGSKAKTNGAKARRVAPPAADEALAEGAAPLAGRVIQRADGFYWEGKNGEAHGPFATLAEAEADLLAGGAGTEEDDPEVPETLQEAESELGISEWIDPDTGAPAEDNVPHIEDH